MELYYRSRLHQLRGRNGFWKIYVADFVNDRIVRMDDMCGTNWTTLGATGTAVGDFGGEQDVFVDTNGQIYVADTFNNRIVRMDDMSGTNWTVLGTTPARGPTNS